jgi:DNA-binding protein
LDEEKARKWRDNMTEEEKPTEEKKEKKPVEETVKEKKTTEAPRKQRVAQNTVFIGGKPPMNYVLAIITSLSAPNAKKITLKARGRAITTAVDAAEITRRRFIKELKVSKIAIGTEEMPAREGENRARMVSTIEITLTKE